MKKNEECPTLHSFLDFREPRKVEVQLLRFQEVLVAHSVDPFSIKRSILKKVCLGCVRCTMDMKPFFLLREIEAQVFEEGNSQVIDWFAWASRIESQNRPDIPRGQAAIILISWIGLKAWLEGFLAKGLDQDASVFRVLAIAEEIGDVKTRLV